MSTHLGWIEWLINFFRTILLAKLHVMNTCMWNRWELGSRWKRKKPTHPRVTQVKHNDSWLSLMPIWTNQADPETQNIWAWLVEWRYLEGIVLGLWKRVPSWAQMIQSRNDVLTPKSVNDTHWTPKFNASGRHQVNRVLKARRDMMMRIEEGSKKCLMAKINQHVSSGEKICKTMCLLCLLIWQRKVPTISFLFPTFTFGFSSHSSHSSQLHKDHSPLGWLGVTQQCWTLVFSISFTDFGVSNIIFNPIICAQLGTLFQGPRTIPSGYLHSPNQAQFYLVFKGLVHRTKKRPKTELDRTLSCSSTIPWKRKLKKNQWNWTGFNQFGSVWTGPM